MFPLDDFLELGELAELLVIHLLERGEIEDGPAFARRGDPRLLAYNLLGNLTDFVVVVSIGSKATAIFISHFLGEPAVASPAVEA